MPESKLIYPLNMHFLFFQIASYFGRHYFEVLLCLSVKLASGFINEFTFVCMPCQGMFVGALLPECVAQTITILELTQAVGRGNCFESYPESLWFKHNWIRPRLCSWHPLSQFFSFIHFFLFFTFNQAITLSFPLHAGSLQFNSGLKSPQYTVFLSPINRECSQNFP